MKKLFLLPFILFGCQVSAQTLFTFGNFKVDKAEFLHAFHKNNISADTGKHAMQEYLQLFIAYKLKLQDARDMQLDTLPSLEADVQSFRHQIESNFLYDRREMQVLTNQAMERGKKDIEVSTIFIKPTDPKDSLKALHAARNLHKSPNAKLKDSEKSGLLITREEMGYITVFTLPYEIENLLYELKPGQWSKPYSFEGGYYLFQNKRERPAAGKIKIAQILITPPADTPNDWQKAKLLADSLYGVIKTGADFGTMAKQFSDDRTTYFNRGEMPVFSVGKYEPEFEKHAFSLTKSASLSKPFKSTYGYHILKLIESNPIDSLSPDAYYSQISQTLLQQPRIIAAKEKLLTRARVQTGFKDLKLPSEDVNRVIDTSLIANKNLTSGKVGIQSPLFSFNDSSMVTVGSWEQFLRNSGRLYAGNLHETYNELWPEFVSQSILENYAARMENFDKDFAEQLKEFRDGNMLFELMQKKIWVRAANDTAGLYHYYQQHKAAYKWGPSAEAIVFFCNNKKTADLMIQELGRQVPWRDIIDAHASDVQADSGRFQFDQLPLDPDKIKPGLSTVVINQFDSTASFIQILNIYPGNEQRTFADAKGLVIEDYQKQLEAEWVNELKRRYPVKVNQEVLASMFK